jgi:hypothetical protein
MLKHGFPYESEPKTSETHCRRRHTTAGRTTTQTRRKPTPTTQAKRNSGKTTPIAIYATPVAR